jgi:Bacterial archaeo-eukaryotic release factor family 2
MQGGQDQAQRQEGDDDVDLHFLRGLYDNPRGDGYVSVYLDTSPTEKAAEEISLRWQAAREQLAAAGADEATLDAAQRAATERAPGRGRAVFARGGAVLLIGVQPEPPAQEISGYAPLPRVVPWLARRPPRWPHVRVAADREGGRVLAVSGVGVEGLPAADAAGSALGAVGVTEVTGESWPVHVARGGGWSEPRFRRSAEETWAETAKRIAEAVTVAADQVKAVFVVVGGDIRERTLVVDQLPKVLRDNVAIVDREVELDAPAFDEAAWGEATWRAALEARARLDQFRAEMDKPRAGRRAVEGLAATLTALRDGLVSDLLLTEDPAWSESATVWAGPGLADAATEKRRLTERGAGEPVRAAAGEALVRAATGTDAQLHFLRPEQDTPDPGDTLRVGALLRAPAAAAR